MTACERIRVARAEVDFTIADHGSIVILTGVSPEAREWIEEYCVNEETQTWAGGIVVEPRYILEIIEGLEASGFRW